MSSRPSSSILTVTNSDELSFPDRYVGICDIVRQANYIFKELIDVMARVKVSVLRLQQMVKKSTPQSAIS
jgi:hypothetical protein